MKTTNISSRISNRFKSKDEEVHNLEEGIAKVLLDKYKPTILEKIENLKEGKVQRVVA